MKTRHQKMDRASRRKTALANNLIWRKPPIRIPNKKKQQNKKACRIKISPTTI